jgi:flagellar hook assembly protein FlgD
LQRVLTTVTLLGLLVASAAAFAITEHLKLIKSPLSAALLSERRGREVGSGHVLLAPTCDCPTSTAILRVRLRHAGRVTVTILDSSDRKVRTIASRVHVQAKTPKLFVWDGRTDAGGLAPDGIYHPSVALPRHTYNFTNNIILDTTAPKVISVATVKRKPVLFPGPGRTVAIRYRFSEPAHPVVYLGGHQIIVGRLTNKHVVKWAGTLEGSPLPAGKYTLAIGARDQAGNETPAVGRLHVAVVVRYVQLSPGQLTVRGGGRLAVHVKTTAKRYTWRLGQRHGAHRGKVLHLRAPTTPGTYRLVVTANGHATTAVVRVRG